MLRTKFSFVLIICLGACQGNPATIISAPIDDAGSQAGDAASTTDGAEDLGPSPEPEVCDGWDNDLDGLVDEATGGDACTTDAGDDGTLQCISGQLVCENCSPGTTRNMPCACGTHRVDTCTPWGTWHEGTCDGCQQAAPICECKPGDEELRRCDSGAGGSTGCIGALWRCEDDCTWHQVDSCEPRNPQCAADQILTQPCGNCGTRKLTCDGCFWKPSPCKAQGQCAPGESRTIPCFSDGCQDGLVAEISCNESCEWSSPSSCTGCAIGGIEETQEPCLVGHPACGFKRHQTICVAGQTISTCGDTSTLTVGTTEQTTIDTCNIECTPGETEACTLPNGQAGERTTGCNADCTLGTPGECIATNNSCVPGTTQTNDFSCGCGAMRTYIYECAASGDGWVIQEIQDDECPACVAGQTSYTGCTLPDGRCGWQTSTCTAQCTEGPLGQCEARPTACIPGTVEVEQVPCAGGGCGLTFTRTKTCQPNGCGWTTVDDTSTCPACSPGATQTQACTTSQGQCGQRVNTCNASTCQWDGYGQCTPLPTACTPGDTQVQNVSCGPNSCGATYPVTQTCNPDGCGWTTTEDQSQCPVCQMGEIEDSTELCVPGQPACGFRKRQCNSQCTWTLLECPPCG